MTQIQVTFESVQYLLNTIPTDLKIICEDKIEYSSHKLLLGLLNSTLASIFLEESFTNENVTLFMPIESDLLNPFLNDGFGLKSKIEEIFTTSNQRPGEHIRPGDPLKYLDEYQSIELIKAEENIKLKVEEQLGEGSYVKDHMEEGEVVVKHVKPRRKKIKKEKPVKKEKEKDLAPVPCEYCGKVFKSIIPLKVHCQRYHENPGNILHQCEKCSYNSLYPHMLKVHIKNQHESETYQCNECGKSFYGVKLYRAHFARIHTEHGQELVRCHECGKETKKFRLKQHMALMHMERRHACNLCNYKAQTGYNLKLHVSKSHLGIKELPKHKCPHCDTTTTNLEFHIKSNHRNIETQ